MAKRTWSEAMMPLRPPPATNLTMNGDNDVELPTRQELIEIIGSDDEEEDLTTDDSDEDEVEFLGELSPSSMQTDSTLPANCIEVPFVRWNNMTLQPGICVELQDGDFLRIIKVFHNRTSNQNALKGNLMRRANRVNDMLPKKLNELCYIAQTSVTKTGAKLQECLVTRQLDDVRCKREIIATNQFFPALSWRGKATQYEWEQSEHWKRDNLRLVVRWVMIQETEGNKIKATRLRTLNREECDKGTDNDPVSVLRTYLGEKRVAEIVQDHAKV